MTSRVAYSTDGKHSRGATCFIVEPLRRSQSSAMHFAIIGHGLLAQFDLPRSNALSERGITHG